MTAADKIFVELRSKLHRATDRMFLWLLVGQWVFAMVLALVVSPYSWEGTTRTLHMHVKFAIVFGGIINALPIALILTRPGWWGTRQVIAVTQMLWSGMLIMITSGRIETHFHVFGSLAFLAFYRDWRVLPTATAVVAIDHVVRGMWWPDSVYGTANPEWWRFIEHAAWVAFEVTCLSWACVRGTHELREAAAREAALAETKAIVEDEVRQRTHELQDSLERYRALVENTDAIPFEYDLERRQLVYIAPQITRLLKCEVTEKLFETSVYVDDRDVFDRSLYRLTPGGPVDVRLVAANGDIVYARAHASHRDGMRVRGILIDITRQQKLEAELRQAQHLESVGRLAAGIAHEINTPIQFVGDSLEFVGDAMKEVSQAFPAEAKTEDLAYLLTEIPLAVERAIEGAGRVTKIVQSMRVFTHPDPGEAEVADINAAVESALTIARNEYRYVADVETNLGALPPIACHIGEINQVLLNIVVNAAHAIADHCGDQRGKITVSTRRDGNFVVISIADTGGGIPDMIRDRIFDPFFTTKEVGRGTGQGLAIAHSLIVDKHRGKLTFDTTVGQGTTFHIWIPIERQATGEAA